MEDRINQALLQLEEDLKEIKSAKEQVEQVTNAYLALKSGIDDYAGMMNTVADDLKSLIDAFSSQKALFDEQSTSFIANVEKRCNDATTDFANSVDSTLKIVDDAVLNFDNKCNDSVTSFKATLENSSKNFSEKIGQMSNSFCESTNTQIERMKEISSHVSRFKEDCACLVSRLDSLKEIINAAKNSHDNHDQFVRTSVANLGNSISSVVTDVSNAESNVLQQISEFSTNNSTEHSILEQSVTRLSTALDSMQSTVANISLVITQNQQTLLNEFQAMNNAIQALDTKMEVHNEEARKNGKNIASIKKLAVAILVLLGIGAIGAVIALRYIIK